MESLICPSCTTIKVVDGRRCNWCGASRPSRGWMPLETIADPWLGTILCGGLRIEQRISSVESLYRAEDHDGRSLFARFRRINRIATPPDWTTRASRLKSVRTRRLSRFFAAIEHDEYAVLLSEHVEGERLRDRLRRAGALPPADALGIAHQIGIAIEAMHAAGFTHGRLNPRALLVSTDGRGTNRTTVISYGLASSLEPPPAEPGYLPDEAPPHAQTNDVFAIGALLFEMLTGIAPLDAAVDASIRSIAGSPFKNPSALRPTLRSVPHLDDLVHHLTEDGADLTITEAMDLLIEAFDDPSSAEIVMVPSRSFVGVETGLGAALSSTAISSEPLCVPGDEGGRQLEVQGAIAVLSDDTGASEPVVDLRAHGLDGQISQVRLMEERIIVGSTRGALLACDLDDGTVDVLCPASDGSAVAVIDANGDLIVAATRRGGLICVSEDAGHVMAPAGRVRTLSVAEHGLRFAVGRASGEVVVYDLVGGTPIEVDDFAAAEVTDIALSADGSELWLSDRDTTTVRDLATRSNRGVVGAASALVESSEALVRDNGD